MGNKKKKVNKNIKFETNITKEGKCYARIFGDTEWIEILSGEEIEPKLLKEKENETKRKD